MPSNVAVASTSMAPIDLEAQTIVAPPQAMMIQSPRSAAIASPQMREPTDEYFGYTFSTSRTRDSRHDDSNRMSVADSEVLPPYTEETDVNLPAYTLHAPEPITLAMYLFKFGFLFPPFWIFGAFILLSPLREPPATTDDTPAWMPEKTEAEKQAIIEKIRNVELKWAKRCLAALVIFTLLAVAGALSAYFILHH
ncbi:hypothetical protein CVT24_008158 [Panaeolus cyanescens]|uniref:Transmembrane protein n=1 Tax=Panaeolus cyanescens TaxID=181874 RepID=A0A409VFE3_9AGAR|nr:hypothetical protein CVT24_008158 [Panaeolus cyanescens]